MSIIATGGVFYLGHSLMLLELLGVSLTLVQAAPTQDVSSSLPTLTSSQVTLSVVVCSIVLLLIVVVIIPTCMDCMNSEVSSESHPACGENTRKWGGAYDYTPADSRNPNAGFTCGEVVNPSDRQSQPLPYAMVPTQVPEQAGFVGYYSNTGSSGMAGYSAGQAPGPSGDHSHRGSMSQNRHFNPLDPQEPPPQYDALGY